MDKGMYDYIKEQYDALNGILNKRERLFGGIVKNYSRRTINKIIIVASGSSYNAGMSAKYFIEKLLRVEVSVRYPYMFVNYDSIFDKNNLVIGISQSGKSSATLEAIKKANELGMYSIAVTSEPESPIADCAADFLLIDCGKETFGAKTKGYTSTLLTLLLFGLQSAKEMELINALQYEEYINNLECEISGIYETIENSNKWYDANKSDLNNATKIMVVGYGPNYGTALEGGIKIKETVWCAVSEHELEEFMHGPLYSLVENCYIIFIASPGSSISRIHTLYDYVSKITEHCYMISSDKAKIEAKKFGVNVSGVEDFSPIKLVIPMQVLACRLSQDKGTYTPTRFPDLDDYLHCRSN